MNISKFIAVGENIHCTRIYKVDGKYARPQADGRYAIEYTADGESKTMPVPEHFMKNADWEAGKVKHCAAAIWLGNNGNDEEKSAGIDYLRAAAKKQVSTGATYLDINVDEFSTDIEERVQLMRWVVGIVQDTVDIPISVDSSNLDILKAGLEACDKSRGRPMLNSVSLERPEAIALAAEHEAVIIASVAGEKDLPSSTKGRLENLSVLMPKLRNAGFQDEHIHIDPLVFPISTDSTNGIGFLESVSAIRKNYGDKIHIVAGLSNVSFGMPCRKLINQVFTWLAVEAGADGGIVDPLQISIDTLNTMDLNSDKFKLAKALLLGEDDFGMNFITASREGKL
ncbi:MAG: dihydropteroate synthase [Kiritimatiellae bacterium]|nr:dihydropteroate synthase [Kiritimatiellia bacterium]